MVCVSLQSAPVALCASIARPETSHPRRPVCSAKSAARCLHSSFRPPLPAELCAASTSPRCAAHDQQQQPHRSVRVRAGPNTPVTEPWWTKNNPENMRSASSVEEYVHLLAEATDKLVVVDFYAKWCHSCRSLFPKLCQLCKEHPDLLLIKVDWDDNRDICKAMGIKVLPYFHFYRGAEGRVAEFSASVSKIQRLRDALTVHYSPRCSLGNNPTLNAFPEYFHNGKMVHEGVTRVANGEANNVVMRSEVGKEVREPEPAI